MNSTNHVITGEQAAEMLGCAVSTFDTLVKQGKFRAKRYGTGLRTTMEVFLEDLELDLIGEDPGTPESGAPAAVAVPVPAPKRQLPTLVGSLQ